MRLTIRQVFRVETRVTDWRSLLAAAAGGTVCAALASPQHPEPTPDTSLLRLGTTILAAGVLLAIADDDTEATAALPHGVNWRLPARLITLLPLWAAALALAMYLSKIPSADVGSLLREATVLCLVAILLGSASYRVLIPGFAVGAALALVTTVILTMALPSGLTPWWSGNEPVPQAVRNGWYIAGGAAVLATVQISRRSSVWTFTRRLRLRSR